MNLIVSNRLRRSDPLGDPPPDPLEFIWLDEGGAGRAMFPVSFVFAWIVWDGAQVHDLYASLVDRVGLMRLTASWSGLWLVLALIFGFAVLSLVIVVLGTVVALKMMKQPYEAASFFMDAAPHDREVVGALRQGCAPLFGFFLAVVVSAVLDWVSVLPAGGV